MKIIAVGDIHGRQTWKEVLKKEPDYDKFVFVGDYFDAFPPMTPERIFETFQEILAFKAAYPDKVVLCIGNHDFQYMPVSGGTERYSGYNPTTKLLLGDIGEWWKWMVAAYQYEDILFTHAGVTKTWAEKHFPAKTTRFWITDGLDQRINEVYERDPEAFKFYKYDSSNCGDDKRQGPFWVRPDALVKDLYDGIRMVVGHTHVAGIEPHGSVTYIDTGSQGDYLRIVDGVMYTGSL